VELSVGGYASGSTSSICSICELDHTRVAIPPLKRSKEGGYLIGYQQMAR
jgi:hypothetical protein